MGKSFTELVIAGSFDLVKGFLIGFRCGTGEEFSYFFHNRSGIRRDTLGEALKDILAIEYHVHLCMEDTVLERFKKAVAATSPQIGLKIVAEKPIWSARFDFSFSINNRETADNVKKLFAGIPKTVALENYQPGEEDFAEHEKAVGGYAPLHRYTFKGSGSAHGEFGSVMELYLAAHRIPGKDLVLTGDIMLEF